MTKIVYNFSVFQPATWQNLNNTDLLEKALEFVDLLYIKNSYLSRLQRKFSVVDLLLNTK